MFHHIHVYFTAAQKPAALAVRELIRREYPDLFLGQVIDRPIGPHPVGSYEIDVPGEVFADFRAFLETNNPENLTMMVHPVTGDDVEDHSSASVDFIGPPMEINRSFFDNWHRH